MKEININELTKEQRRNLKKLGKILNPPKLKKELDYEKKQKEATWYNLSEYVQKYPKVFNIWATKKGRTLFTINSDTIKTQYNFERAQSLLIAPELNNDVIHQVNSLNIKATKL